MRDSERLGTKLLLSNPYSWRFCGLVVSELKGLLLLGKHFEYLKKTV